MRVLSGLVFLFLIPGHAWLFGTGLATIAGAEILWIPLLGGFVAGYVLWRVLFSRIDGLATLEHELTHALVALFFLRRITRFHVTRNDGGYVSYGGGLGGRFANDMIGLAPYFLPTLTMPLAVLRPALPASWELPVLGFIGATLAFHTVSTAAELRRNWHGGTFRPGHLDETIKTDIGQCGKLYSFVVIVSLTLALHGIVWWLVTEGYAATWQRIVESGAFSLAWWEAGVECLAGWVRRFTG